MGSGGTFCPQKSFESTGSRRERAHPLDGCQESIACARSEHGSRRDGSRSGVALGFERATWARRRGRPVGRVRSAPSRRAGSIRPLAGAAARPAAAVVPAAASASASRANWLAFDERPSSQNPDCHLKVVLESCERGRFSQSRMMAAARAALQPALTARACTRTPSSRACRCAQSMRSWCCSSAALRPHRFPASPPSVVPLPPAPPPADAVVRALSGSRPRGGGSSVGPGRAARLEDGTPTRVPILSFCSFLPVSRLCRETAECVPS